MDAGTAVSFEKDFIEDDSLDCWHCGAENSLEWGQKDMDLDESGEHTLAVEGLMCKHCKDLFMDSSEGARFMNVKAKFLTSGKYYEAEDGEVKEHILQ